jgi:hypothetical protein
MDLEEKESSIKMINTCTNPTLVWKNAKGKEFSYLITPKDRHTLLLSCAYEGKPQIAVCWTLIQRFAFLYPRYKTLDSFLAAYVQPINPAWMINGLKHLAYIERLKQQYKGKELENQIIQATKRAQKRKEFAESTITNKTYILIVDDILNGKIPSPNTSTQHYCASFAKSTDSYDVAFKKATEFGLKRNMIFVDIKESILPGTNWFFATKSSSNFKVIFK